jgi:hypothetical protein
MLPGGGRRAPRGAEGEDRRCGRRRRLDEEADGMGDGQLTLLFQQASGEPHGQRGRDHPARPAAPREDHRAHQQQHRVEGPQRVADRNAPPGGITDQVEADARAQQRKPAPGPVGERSGIGTAQQVEANAAKRENEDQQTKFDQGSSGPRGIRD